MTRRTAIVLAAGKGTRMKSRLPKVLHQACGRPLLGWVLEAARAARCERILVVVGHGAEEVRSRYAADDVEWILQEEQNGTGHAVACAEGSVPPGSTVVVLSGDVPLVRASTIENLARAAEAGWGAMAVADLAEPGSLGRVVSEGGRLGRIVEVADATPEELAVQRINAGLYALPGDELFAYLAALSPANAQGELYLTDAVTAAASDGKAVALVDLADPAEALGVNSRADLARAHRALVARRLEELMAEGVTVLDPGRTLVEAEVCVGKDTVLHPGVSLRGHTRVGEDCELHQGAWLLDSELENSVTVAPYSVLEGARVASDCRVGPFARLRPASVLLSGARVGNFVEIKNSRLAEGVKAGHLAYLGDAEIGPGANIGAGTVTCNYDGVAKHRTDIGAGAFIGSDTMLVAPLTVGDDATTAAGSVITQDVPDGALAVGRARQRNIPGWAERKKHTGKEKG